VRSRCLVDELLGEFVKPGGRTGFGCSHGEQFSKTVPWRSTK
jgi:hypothetical protein